MRSLVVQTLLALTCSALFWVILACCYVIGQNR